MKLSFYELKKPKIQRSRRKRLNCRRSTLTHLSPYLQSLDVVTAAALVDSGEQKPETCRCRKDKLRRTLTTITLLSSLDRRRLAISDKHNPRCIFILELGFNFNFEGNGVIDPEFTWAKQVVCGACSALIWSRAIGLYEDY